MQVFESTPEKKMKAQQTFAWLSTDPEMDTNAISFLKQQHREVEELFEEFEEEKESGSTRNKKKIFEEIAGKLTIHTKLEEEYFYPAVKSLDKELVLEAYEEHDVVKNLIKKIKATKPNSISFDAKVKVLKDTVEHHVDEEETELFPKCSNSLDEDKLEAIGKKMIKEFQRLQ